MGFKRGITVKGQAASARQKQIADAIFGECKRLGCGANTSAAAYACAVQESVMGNLMQTTADDDTGIMQQGRNWITVAGTKDGARATNAFFLSGTSDPKKYASTTGGAPGWKAKYGSVNSMPRGFNGSIMGVQVSVGGYGDWERESRAAYAAWDGAGGGGGNREADASGGGGGSSSASQSRSVTVTKPYAFARKENEGSWPAMVRLAEEVGWRLFVSGNDIVYSDEPTLYRQNPVATIDPDEDPWVLGFDFDIDWNRRISEADLKVVLGRWSAPPGSVIEMDNAGPATGRWLVKSVRRSLFDPVAEVSLIQPAREKLEPAPETETKTVGGGGGASEANTREPTTGDNAGKAWKDGWPLTIKGKYLGGSAAHHARAFGNWQSDDAVDIGCPRGTPVLAVVTGKIVRLGGSWNGGSGNPDGFNVTLTGGGASFFYTHLRWRKNLRIGQTVQKGEMLGSSGAAAGVDHLHIGAQGASADRLFTAR